MTTASNDTTAPCAWQPLWDFADREAARLGDSPGGVLEPIGLFLREPGSPPWGGYDSTPTNSTSFAATGGDGVHFGVLSSGGDGPVVMTVPMSSARTNLVVGADVREFLALGCASGFFVLEQLSYRPGEAARIIETCPLQPGDDGEELLARLRAELRLAPWPSVDRRMSELQDEFGSLVEVAAVP